MSEKRRDEDRELATWIGERYNDPPAVPSEEIWATIAERIESVAEAGSGPSSGGPADAVGDANGPGQTEVIDLASRRRPARPLRWVAAAAAVLVVGFVLGRGTAPGVRGGGAVGPEMTAAAPRATSGLQLATREHLARSEELLTMVRADAASGAVDPMVDDWARDLLAQTRLILDVSDDGGEVSDLLLDLELVLVQIVGAGSGDAMEEMDLAIRGMDEGSVLSRLAVAAGA